MERSTIFYFNDPGDHTSEVIDAIKDRLADLAVEKIVVATDTGKTALQVAQSMSNQAEVIVIAYKELPAEMKTRLRSLRALVYDQLTPAFQRNIPDIDLATVRHAFTALGQGFKVAIEVVIMATEQGIVTPGTDIIGVGGTGSGADTAIVVKATKARDIYGPEKDRRLEVREVIVMPRRKKW